MSIKRFPNSENRVPGNVTFNDDGSVVNTLQPSVLVYASANVENQIGTAATGFVTIAFNTEIRDQGGDYASNTFTAPQTGVYHFDVAVLISNLTAAADRADLNLVTSNRTYRLVAHVDANRMPQDMTLIGSVDADMDINDTATVAAQVQGEASDVVDIFGGASPLGTFMSVHLVC